MSVKLLTEYHLGFLSLKVQPHLSLLISKCHIVGNHMSWLNHDFIQQEKGQPLNHIKYYLLTDLLIHFGKEQSDQGS